MLGRVNRMVLIGTVLAGSQVFAGILHFEGFEGLTASSPLVGQGIWSNHSNASSNPVVSDAGGQAYAGSQFAVINPDNAAHTARGAFSNVPTTGTFWVDFFFYNGFDDNAASDPDHVRGDGNPVVSIRAGTTEWLNVIENRNTGKYEFYVRGTGSFASAVDWASDQWLRGTWEIKIDGTNNTGRFYLNGVDITGEKTLDTGTPHLNDVFLSAGLTNDAPGGFRVDNVGYYDTDPIPEPASLMLIGLGGVMALRKRR